MTNTNISLFGRRKNDYLYIHLAKSEGMITEQTGYNLRVEYIEELTYQFSLRDKLLTLNAGTKAHESLSHLIEKSCERCRNYDFLIQSNANQIIKAA